MRLLSDSKSNSNFFSEDPACSSDPERSKGERARDNHDSCGLHQQP